MSTSRRDFIRYVVAGSIAAGCPVDLSLLAAEPSTIEVDGEHNQICHEIRDGHTILLETNALGIGVLRFRRA